MLFRAQHLLILIHSRTNLLEKRLVQSMLKAVADKYPVSHQLEDGAKVNCSLMTSDDLDALSKFLNRLTQTDLAYLQADITDPELQKRWLQSAVVEASRRRRRWSRTAKR